MASTSQLKMASQVPAITSRCARGRRGGIALFLFKDSQKFHALLLITCWTEVITWQPQDTGSKEYSLPDRDSPTKIKRSTKNEKILAEVFFATESFHIGSVL